MTHINLMNLHQDRFQGIQDFRDQYLAIEKVCDVLEQHKGNANEKECDKPYRCTTINAMDEI